MWSVCQSLNALTQSHNDHDGPKIISDTLFKRYSITKRRPNTVTLFFFLSFNVFARMDNSSAEIIVYWRVVVCDSHPSVGGGPILPTPAQTPTPTKIVDSGRLQLHSRLRLRSPVQSKQFLRTGIIRNSGHCSDWLGWVGDGFSHRYLDMRVRVCH